MPGDRARRRQALGRRTGRVDLDAVPLRQQPAGFGVNGRTLEGGTADIDAKDFL